MTREELILSPEYWTTNAQLDLYNCASKFMEKHGMNRKQLAEYLNVSKSYVTQLLNGEFDHRLSKFMELSLSFGYVPKVIFESIPEVVSKDANEQLKWNTKIYDKQSKCIHARLHTDEEYSINNFDIKEKEVA